MPSAEVGHLAVVHRGRAPRSDVEFYLSLSECVVSVWGDGLQSQMKEGAPGAALGRPASLPEKVAKQAAAAFEQRDLFSLFFYVNGSSLRPEE